MPHNITLAQFDAIASGKYSANADFAIKHVADYNFHLTDAISLLSASRSLADLDDSRARHFDGPNAVNEQPQSAVGAFMSV